MPHPAFALRQPAAGRGIVTSAFAAGIAAKVALPLRVSVLKIASPPLIYVRKKLSGAAPTDSELSPLTERTAAPLGDSAGAGTSAATGAQSEQV
jgi:hypothetical protein